MKCCICHMLMRFIYWRNIKPYRKVLGGKKPSSSQWEVSHGSCDVILPKFEVLHFKSICVKYVLSFSRWLPAAFGNHRCNLCDPFQFPISRSLQAALAMHDWQLLHCDKGVGEPWLGNVTVGSYWWIHKSFPKYFLLLLGFCCRSRTYKGQVSHPADREQFLSCTWDSPLFKACGSWNSRRTLWFSCQGARIWGKREIFKAPVCFS